MAGFVFGTGSGVLAAAAVYYTMSTHLARDTTALQAELDRTTLLLDSSLDPKIPSAPVSQIGPSRNPYEPRFSDLLRTKWNSAVERGVNSVRSTDWTSVGAGIAESGRGVVRKLSGEAEPVLENAERTVEYEGRRIVRDAQHIAADAAQRTEAATENMLDRVVSAVNAARETTAAAAHDAGVTLKEAVREVKEDSVQLAHIVKDTAVQKEREWVAGVKEKKKELDEYHEGILSQGRGLGVISAAAEDLSRESFTGGAAAKVRAQRAAEGSLGRLV